MISQIITRTQRFEATIWKLLWQKILTKQIWVNSKLHSQNQSHWKRLQPKATELLILEISSGWIASLKSSCTVLLIFNKTACGTNLNGQILLIINFSSTWVFTLSTLHPDVQIMHHLCILLYLQAWNKRKLLASLHKRKITNT